MANPINILLVEDDRGTCQLVKRVLSRPDQNFEYELDTASTLSSAVKQLHEKTYDNILLDLGLPDSNGIETVEKIHKSSPDVPIIVFTCSDEKEMEIESMGRGVEDYFIKGTDIWEELVPRIRHAIGNKRATEGLARSYKHFKSIIKNSRCAVVYISLKGQILEFNSKAEQLWHCRREGVLGKNFFRHFIMEDDRDSLCADIQRALSGGLVKGTHTPITLVDGTKYSLFWNLDNLETGQEDSASALAIAHAIARQTPTRNDFYLIPSLVYNPNFEDTVNMVLGSIGEIVEKIDDAASLADTESLSRLAEEMCEPNDNNKQNMRKKNNAVKRLVTSLFRDG